MDMSYGKLIHLDEDIYMNEDKVETLRNRSNREPVKSGTTRTHTIYITLEIFDYASYIRF